MRRGVRVHIALRKTGPMCVIVHKNYNFCVFQTCSKIRSYKNAHYSCFFLLIIFRISVFQMNCLRGLPPPLVIPQRNPCPVLILSGFQISKNSLALSSGIFCRFLSLVCLQCRYIRCWSSHIKPVPPNLCCLRQIMRNHLAAHIFEGFSRGLWLRAHSRSLTKDITRAT